DPEVDSLRAEVAAWDGVYTKESRAAAIYERVRAELDSERRRDASFSPRVVIEATLIVLNDKLPGPVRWGLQPTPAFRHPLLHDFDLAPVERSGGAGTVEADGATYREILDVADWDRSQAVNVPGQSGQPGSPYYDSLLKLWGDNGYFPLAF